MIYKYYYITQKQSCYGEDAHIYEIVLSYNDLCDIFDWEKDPTISNILESPHLTFERWFREECSYSAHMIFPHYQEINALFDDDGEETTSDDWDGLEDDIWLEREVLTIRVVTEDLVMAFLLHWTNQNCASKAA